MNCREWEETLALYASGDLDARRAAEAERHLAACAGCQIFASGLLESLETMRAAHRQEIAEAHYAALRARLLSRLRPVAWWRRGWLRWAAAGVVAAGALWLAMAARVLLRPAPQPVVAFVRPPAPALTATVQRVRPAPPIRAETHPRRKPAAPAEPLTVRLVTDDPNVVIYWITDPRGE